MAHQKQYNINKIIAVSSELMGLAMNYSAM